ncbi:MAG: hypothetical protein U0183_25565 [Polyangiaceae bacterium]
MEWRRVSDWKQTISLVELRDVPLSGLVTPHEQLRERFPRFAALVADAGLARVEPDVAQRLRAAGAVIYEVGYHRGSDGLLYAEIAGGRRQEQQVDVGALDYGEASDDERDVLHDDGVDAILRTLSEGVITERAVILAHHAPPLTDAPVPGDDKELSAIEALDPSQLPDVSEATIRRVAEALRTVKPPQLGPSLTPEQRRAYMRKAGVVGVLSLVVAVGGWIEGAPILGMLAALVAVLCATIVLLHAVALRQAR